MSWYLKTNLDINDTPNTAGIRTTKIPAPNTNVMSSTRFLSLNTDPKYAGSKNVIQQGANNATIPAKNAAIRETDVTILDSTPAPSGLNKPWHRTQLFSYRLGPHGRTK